MTPSDRDRLRALANQATPGPWKVWLGSHVVEASASEDVEFAFDADCYGSNHQADAEFIAACSPDVIRRLCDENAVLTAEVARLREGTLMTRTCLAARLDGPDRPPFLCRLELGHDGPHEACMSGEEPIWRWAQA